MPLPDDNHLAAQLARTETLARTLGTLPELDGDEWELVEAVWRTARGNEAFTARKLAVACVKALASVLAACADPGKRPELLAGAAAHLIQCGARERAKERMR
jgi:hypothetical protein